MIMRKKLRVLFLCMATTISGSFMTCSSNHSEVGSDGRKYEFYPNDSPRKAYQVNPKGNPTGWVTEWNQDGSLKSDYFLNDLGNKEGPYREWYPSGKISRTGTYLDGKKVDTWSEYFYVNGDGQQQRYDTLFIGGQKVRYRELLWEVIPPFGLSAETTHELINGSEKVLYEASWYETGSPASYRFEEDQDGFSFRNGYDYEGKRLFSKNTCNSIETKKDF
jgi:hypothetical protein